MKSNLRSKSIISFVLCVMLIFSFTVAVYADTSTIDAGSGYEVVTGMDIDQIEGVIPGSDLYNDLKSELDLTEVSPRISFDNYIATYITSLGPDAFMFAVQNIAVDTLDSCTIKVKTYNRLGDRLTSSTRVEKDILPMFWRENDFHATNYSQALITVTCTDGGKSASKIIKHTAPY